MPMKTSSIFRLLQISDSAFPRGAFAHSFGLETFVQEGAVDGAEPLREWLENLLLHGVGPLEGVYLREAHRLAAEGDLAGLVGLDGALSAAKPVASLRRASRVVGGQFLRTALGFSGDAFLHDYGSAVRTERSPGHHAVAFGAVARALGIPLEGALAAYCFGAVSGLVSAAVRLIPLGQTDGQRVVAALEEPCGAAAAEAMRRPLEDAYSLGPGHEIRAMGHRRLYTRLFVS